jgi:hypothetical protein
MVFNRRVVAEHAGRHSLPGPRDPQGGRRPASSTRRAIRRATLPALLATATLLVCPRAGAAGGDPASAEELFRQGRDALIAKQYDVACAKLAESERLDPKVGTLINLALCEEATEKLLPAQRTWQEATGLARTVGDAREGYTSQQLAAVGARIPRVTVRVAAGAPAGTRVQLDGSEVPASQIGGPMPVEIGEHVVVTGAASHADSRFLLVTHAGFASEVIVEPGPLVSPPPAPAAKAEPASDDRWSPGTRQWLAYGVGCAGFVGLGIGTAFGIQALVARNDPNCSGGVCNTAQDAQVQRDGVTAGNVATGAFIAGGALLAGGVVLWLTAPRSRAPASVVVQHDARGASLDLVGIW